MLNNVPAKNAEDEIEHEKRADNHNRHEVKPVESSAKRVVRLTTNSTTGFFNHVGCFQFAPGRGAKYYDERCLYAGLSVCLSACPLAYLKTTTQTSRNLQCILLPVTAARSSSDDNAMRYVLPVLCMTSFYSHNKAPMSENYRDDSQASAYARSRIGYEAVYHYSPGSNTVL